MLDATVEAGIISAGFRDTDLRFCQADQEYSIL